RGAIASSLPVRPTALIRTIGAGSLKASPSPLDTEGKRAGPAVDGWMAGPALLSNSGRAAQTVRFGILDETSRLQKAPPAKERRTRVATPTVPCEPPSVKP